MNGFSKRIRVLCAPDSFKESIDASAAAEAMAAGVRRTGCEADVCPIADGGEGTLDALLHAMQGAAHEDEVVGPRGTLRTARFGLVSAQGIGIVELAEASGLALLTQAERDPTRTTTFGTGELIRRARERGAETVIVGIGGSATIDGGLGLAQAMGARCFDARGDAITQPITGGMLRDIARIVPPSRETLPRIRVACDVTNPLLGERGAASVYGPQKGATPAQVRELERGLAHVADVLGIDPETPGFGAAGGAAIGLVAILGGQLERGIDLVLDTVRFDERCQRAALVLTGEGRLDVQSLSGKAAMGVAQRAARLGVPTIAIVGSTGDGAERCIDRASGGCLDAYVSLADRFGRDRAMSETAVLIDEIAEEIVQRPDG